MIMNKMIKYIIRSNHVPEGYLDIRLIWGESRWLKCKYDFIEKGYIESTYFLLSLPIHRTRFIIAIGTFGLIEIGLTKDFHITLAIKRLTSHGCSIDYCNALQSTLNGMCDLEHDNLLKSYISQDYCGHFYLCTKLCESNLVQYIVFHRKNNSYNYILIKKIITDIVKGVAALHNYRNPIIHGNLKPSNVLIYEGNVIKLADFGIYDHIYPPNKSVLLSKKIWWSNECLITYKASKIYEPTLKSDIQSLGMVIHYVFAKGKHPYGDAFDEIVENITNNHFQLNIESIDLWNLLEKMLDVDPSNRPSVYKVLKHIYFWTDEEKWEFLNVCLSFANCQYQPLYSCPKISKKFCTTLERNWYRSATKLYWIQSAYLYFPVIPIPYGVQIDSPIGLMKFLLKCRYEFPWIFCQSGYILKIFSQLPCYLYDALIDTEWAEKTEFLNFNLQ